MRAYTLEQRQLTASLMHVGAAPLSLPLFERLERHQPVKIAILGASVAMSAGCDRNLQPHGVYPAVGDDAWIAIACVDDASRDALRSIVGELDDGAIATWTITHTVSEAEAILIEAGVPAHGVQNSAECGADPQFAAREHFIEVPHTSEGAMVIENTRCKLSRTPGAPSHAGPELGEHNVYVLQEILGYDDEQLANAFASLAME